MVSNATSGHLSLTFVEAKLTRDTEVIGKMDPYIKGTLREEYYCTTVKYKAGKHPIWN